MLSRVLYRDGLMLVIDKPAGLPVHRGPKGGASLEDYFDALRYGLPRAPSLAHRLDKDTSGCLVLGRHRKALAHLGLLFKHGKVGKTYWAVVEGGPGRRRGRHRPAARPARRHPRLVDEARSERPAVGDEVEGDGAVAASSLRAMPSGAADDRSHLARARAGHRAHAPAARALRRAGLADRRRQHLRQRRRASAGRSCICTRARSWCRSRRTASPCASSRRCRRTCASGCARADGTRRELYAEPQ